MGGKAVRDPLGKRGSPKMAFNNGTVPGMTATPNDTNRCVGIVRVLIQRETLLALMKEKLLNKLTSSWRGHTGVDLVSHRGTCT